MCKQPRPATINRAVATDDAADHQPQTISVDEINARYPGQWILLQVTAYADGWPSAGRLLAHSDSYDEASQARSAVCRDLNPADGPLYLFDAFPLIRTGEEFRLALAEPPDDGCDPFRWPRV
jgi:hypothetical protein